MKFSEEDLNDYEYALDEMKNILSTYFDRQSNCPSEALACIVAIQALEKQIPKKPIKHSIIRNEQTWICPICNRLYWERDHLSDYCSSCGQKLDLD